MVLKLFQTSSGNQYILFKSDQSRNCGSLRIQFALASVILKFLCPAVYIHIFASFLWNVNKIVTNLVFSNSVNERAEQEQQTFPENRLKRTMT